MVQALGYLEKNSYECKILKFLEHFAKRFPLDKILVLQAGFSEQQTPR